MSAGMTQMHKHPSGLSLRIVRHADLCVDSRVEASSPLKVIFGDRRPYFERSRINESPEIVILLYTEPCKKSRTCQLLSVPSGMHPPRSRDD